MPPKTAANKARVRSAAKGRVDENNNTVIEGLLANAEAEMNEWKAMPKEWQKANPYTTSLLIGRVTSSQGEGGFSILFPQKEEPVQVRVLGNAALEDKIAQVFKTVKLAGAEQWPLAICQMPAASSHVKTGELLALLEGSHATQFGKLGFKVPAAADGLDDVFESPDGDEDIDIDDI
jgi:hypothetical protein